MGDVRAGTPGAPFVRVILDQDWGRGKLIFSGAGRFRSGGVAGGGLSFWGWGVVGRMWGCWAGRAVKGGLEVGDGGMRPCEVEAKSVSGYC